MRPSNSPSAAALAQQPGFINAILRGYLREADATWKLLTDLKAADPVTGCSHPEWLVARWQKHFGAEKTARLLEWKQHAAKDICARQHAEV